MKDIIGHIFPSRKQYFTSVDFRHFGGIKLGTGGLVRAYGGTAAECLRNAPTQLVKSKVWIASDSSFSTLRGKYYYVLL